MWLDVSRKPLILGAPACDVKALLQEGSVKTLPDEDDAEAALLAGSPSTRILPKIVFFLEKSKKKREDFARRWKRSNVHAKCKDVSHLMLDSL